MARNTDKPRGGFDVGETGGALSGLLAEDEELDRHALWRLGTWGAASVGAVIVALLATQSSIGIRRDQSASVDILKQAQQLQLSAKDSQNETRRLASAIDTLNGDRDRLYSRVAVLEQGLDSVTGAIARPPASSPSQASASQAGQNNSGQGNSSQGNSSQGNSGQASANQSNAALSSANPTSSNQPNVSQASASPGPATATGSTVPSSPAAATPTPATGTVASNAPATTAAVEPQASAAKPSPAPVSPAPAVTAVAATAPATTEKATVAEKQDKQASPAASSEPGTKSATAQQGGTAHPSGSLVVSKSMMGPPDPAAGKLIESAALPKIVSPPPLPEVAAVTPKASEEADAPASASSAPAPELVASRTEFGVDVGSANSIAGLRALWRGLQKSHSNAALAKLRPIIVIKENSTGLGMQLRLVAGPINDAAAAAKICASLTVNDRGCTTAVFEGQRLALGADEVDKTEAGKAAVAKPETDDKPASNGSRSGSRRHYSPAKRSRVAEEASAPKPEPSTLSRLLGRRE